MSNTELDGNESTDVESRTRRALERVLTVTHTDGTPIADDENPTVVSVHSGNSGKERRVDVREGRCTCPDHKHRGVECYHIRRARMALGVEPVDTATLAACDVHEQFASNAPGPAVLTSDGGLVGGDSVDESDDDSTDSAGSDSLDPRVREHVEEHGSPAHGYDHAPDRSEPADFGHGESTGVQEL
jgi:predicted nucleic acid-binding Zn finger protein